MKYFNDITDLEQAKLKYRKLAKQLHPDAGGAASEFHKLQEEYKTVLLQIQQNQNKAIRPNLKPSAENELINELGKLAKVLIKKQVPQNYLRQKIITIESSFKKDLMCEIVNLLDRFK